MALLLKMFCHVTASHAHIVTHSWPTNTLQQVADADILVVINKLAKQRRDAIEQYTAGEAWWLWL